MSQLVVQAPGSSIALVGRELVVRRAGHEVLRRAVRVVSDVQLYGNVELTAPARLALLQAGIEISLHSPTGQLLGMISPPVSPSARRRMLQWAVAQDPARAVTLAAAMLQGKVDNQRQVLVRAGREDPGVLDAGAIAAMRLLSKRIGEVTSNEALMGLEGAAARHYFPALGRAVRNDAFRFAQRSRRPPRDPFNACLSFGYTLLVRRVASALARAGLDPHIGCLHAPKDGRLSLALDLMEEWRPLVVDRVVLRLVNRRQLVLDDFRDPRLDLATLGLPPTDDATVVATQPDAEADAEANPYDPNDPLPIVYLGETGRAVFLRAWSDVWRTRMQYPPRDAQYDLQQILEMQAVALAQAMTDAARPYTPFVPR